MGQSSLLVEDFIRLSVVMILLHGLVMLSGRYFFLKRNHLLARCCIVRADRYLQTIRQRYMAQQESEIKPLNREQLIQLLTQLAKRDPEAVAVFAARCALRVLPFATGNGRHENGAAYDRFTTFFILSFLGLEYRSIQGGVFYASVSEGTEASKSAENIIYAAANAATYAARNEISSAITEATDACNFAIAFFNEEIITRELLSDLQGLQNNDTDSVKREKLWLYPLTQNISKVIDEWLKTMTALLGDLAQVYEDLLHGEPYPKEKILLLINKWYRQSDHQNTEKSASNSESSKGQSTQTITKYGQTHSHLYDGLAQKDSLGRQRLVDAMADILAAKENTEHQTIGLLGDWGAGKSTFIKLLKSALEERSTAKFLFAEFNAWEYEHTDHMQAGVAREALKGLVADLGWWQKLFLAWKFSWQEKPWQVIRIVLATVSLIAVTIVGSLQFEGWQQIAAWIGFGSISTLVIWKLVQSLQALFKSPLVNEWKNLLSLPDYERYLGTIPIMKQQILKLCKLRLGIIDQPSEKQQRLLFVVDDLDRCSQDGVVRTLEAVRLIMGIPQVTVIIAIDQRIALASLALHYKDLAGYHDEQDPGAIARDYLGKVIQLPVQLHAADGATVTSFVDEVLLANIPKVLFSGHSSDNDHSLELTSTSESITESITESFEPELITPQVMYAEERTEYQLSPGEREAFKEQVNLFGFHNPRQLKRLYNSFNLLRHLYGSDQVNYHMQALFWLEYLNSLSAEKRREAEKNRDKYVALDDERYKTIELQVKPFVLPALTTLPKKD